jgi:AraC-like DNA-binding protein
MSITFQEISCTEFKPQASIGGQESDSLPKRSHRQIGGDSFSLEQLRGAMSELYYAIELAMRAQGLMLATGASLSQIAADCGLADQAHFTKLFRRFVGDSPGAWRRARVPPLAT